MDNLNITRACANIGFEKAQEAAQELGLGVVLPISNNNPNRKTDFNDILQESGVEEVVKQLENPIIKNEPQANLRIFTVKEFLSTEFRSKELIINPILPKQGLMMIFARSGVGKTHLALYLACKMASGKNCFNDKWKINKPWKVLYIDGEMPASTMQSRLASLFISSDDSEDNNNLSIITQDGQEFGRMPNIATIEGQNELEPFIADHDVIVVDNLSTLCNSGKENEAQSWLPIQEWALRLRSQGKAIIFIHHAGKNNDQRGTSKKEDILDTVINLKRPDDYEKDQGARFEVHFEKSRGFMGDDAKPFEASLEIIDNKLVWNLAEIEDLELKRILELDALNTPQREIAKELGINATKVNRLLMKHKNKGK